MNFSQNPPTVSGLIVISGSYGFDGGLSDFSVLPLILTEALPDPQVTVMGQIFTPADMAVTSTAVTTSGIIIIDLFPGAGGVYIVPVVMDARLFPIFQQIFPTDEGRVYPRLPQFSVLIP